MSRCIDIYHRSHRPGGRIVVGFIALMALAAACGGSDRVTNKETHKVVPKGKRLVEIGVSTV